MKRVLTVWLVCMSISGIAIAATPEVPPIVTAGLEAYQKSGFKAALDLWMKGSPMESDKTSLVNITGAIASIETAYGKMTGYEVVKTFSLSPSTLRVYLVINYEKGPLFASFYCYKSKDGWIIPKFLCHTDVERIFPESLMKAE